jgi:hypothetical protein
MVVALATTRVLPIETPCTTLSVLDATTAELRVVLPDTDRVLPKLAAPDNRSCPLTVVSLATLRVLPREAPLATVNVDDPERTPTETRLPPIVADPVTLSVLPAVTADPTLSVLLSTAGPVAVIEPPIVVLLPTLRVLVVVTAPPTATAPASVVEPVTLSEAAVKDPPTDVVLDIVTAPATDSVLLSETTLDADRLPLNKAAPTTLTAPLKVVVPATLSVLLAVTALAAIKAPCTVAAPPTLSVLDI